MSVRGAIACWALGLGLLALRVSTPRAAAQPSAPPLPDAEPSAQSALQTLREHVRSGDVDGALASLDALTPESRERPELRYLRARLYEKKERIREALDSLPSDVRALPNVVARDIRTRRALLLARSGRCAEARPMLIALARYDGPDAEKLISALNLTLLLAGPASALVLLRDVRSAGVKRFAVRISLAKVLAMTGDNAGAIRELRALYVDFPDHARMPEVESELRARSPGWSPTNEEHFARAEHWLDAARVEQAQLELTQITLPKSHNKRERAAILPQLQRLTHLRGMVLFRLRTHYAEAAKVLAQSAALGGSTESADTYHAAQALARADRDAEAVRAYKAFAKRFPKDALTPAARHEAAWLELRHHLPGGEAHMRELLQKAEQRGARSTVADAIWELAIYDYEIQHCDRALPLFERYASTADGPLVKGRGLYWAGRCAARLGQRGRALDYYRTTLAIEPLNWYSLLAQAQLRAAGEDPGLPFGPEPERAPISIPALDPAALPLPAAADFYAKVGLVADAVKALRQDETALREGRDDDGLPLLAAAYHALGEYNRPYVLAERERQDVLRRALTPSARPIWDAMFPRPYAAEVASACQAVSLEPELAYAVMRRESAYNPSVVSSADAIGLMQLIERTAKANADEIGLPSFERSMLYDPGINVRLGSHYLAQLIARYHGQAVPAIAAYNAGEHRVDPWLKRAAKAGNKQVELDWFVEDIPFEQTRMYVKRVVASWARYKYLADPSGWPLDLQLSWKP